MQSNNNNDDDADGCGAIGRRTPRAIKKAGGHAAFAAALLSASLLLALVASAATLANSGDVISAAYAAEDDDDGSMMMEEEDGDKGKSSDAMMEEEKKGDGKILPRLLKGQVSNVQLGEDGRPEWVQSGVWVLRGLGGGNDNSINFLARIVMVAPDGTSLHRHSIGRLQVSEHSTEDAGSTHVLKGTVTVQMSGGSVSGVPLTIKVMNKATVAIWIGPDKVDGHFGTGPVYGTVFQSRALYAGVDDDSGSAGQPGPAMMEQKLKRTNVPVTIPLTRGFVDGSEVFYISTEASDKDLAAHLTNITGFRVAYTPALARTPPASLANIYAFSNGIEGEGPLGFQPNVADSQPGDPEYSPLWRINVIEWVNGTTPRELRSEGEIFDAQTAGQVKITPTNMVVNCPFVEWNDGSLKMREDKTLTDETAYGGGQVLEIDTDAMEVTFVAHRGFAPDGSTIYYIATDASAKEAADMLGVVHAPRVNATLLTGSSSDLWVFTNGIPGTGPMGFQASVAGSNIGDSAYSPLWRILATTWSDAGSAKFLTTSAEISAAAADGRLKADIAGFVVNCPFVEVPSEEQ